jgi:hypothetical protein
MTGANRSSAVMQQRRTVAPDALDYFPTPPWATRALCEFLEDLNGTGSLKQSSCWEPACGEGHMTRPLAEYFGHVRASDVHRYGDWHEVADFTLAPMVADEIGSVDWVITNPPFRLALEFIKAATVASRCGFAMLTRGAFLEGGDRHRQLWSVFPPAYVLQFSERVVMLEGRLIRAGEIDPFSDQPDRRARSATSYCWLVWLPGQSDTRQRWIGPCRLQLERAGDYPEYPFPQREAEAGLFA